MTVKQIINWIFDDELGIEIGKKRYYRGFEISRTEIEFGVRERMKAHIKVDVKLRESLGKKVPTKYSKLRYSNHLDWMIKNDVADNVDTYSVDDNLSLIAIQACREEIKIIMAVRDNIIRERELAMRLEYERRHRKPENLDYLRFSKTGTDSYISVSSVNGAIEEYLSTKDW